MGFFQTIATSSNLPVGFSNSNSNLIIKKNIARIKNAVHCHSWLSGNKDCHEFRFSIVRIVISVSIVTSLQDCLVSQKTILQNCDNWDTDCNSYNWEPEFMTIFVTWQLIATLDSIRNSGDVCIMILANYSQELFHFSQELFHFY